MNVCAACGVIAPGDLPCEACRTSARTDAPTPTASAYLVWTRARFQCRGCGRLSALDAIVMDGTARCVLCGLVQAFDVGAWRAALAHAHAVGDLAGGEGRSPHPRWSLGAANPHRDIGVRRALDTLTLSGAGQVDGVAVSRALRVQVAPGHPLCDVCAEPLELSTPSEGRIGTRCRTCATSALYEVDAGVLAACHGLRGVISEATRAEVREARTQLDTAGLQALSCPSCSAPLKWNGKGRIVDCTFCHATVRVPASETATADVEPTPMWLLFSGPSAERRALQKGTDKAQILAAEEIKLTGVRRWLALVPAAIVASGMLAVTGLGLFFLIRLGLLDLW